jgi:hypothetical protein
VTADSLPLGFASFVLVETWADGTQEIAGRFVSEDLAESSAVFLRIHAPSKSFTVTRATPVLPGLEVGL